VQITTALTAIGHWQLCVVRAVTLHETTRGVNDGRSTPADSLRLTLCVLETNMLAAQRALGHHPRRLGYTRQQPDAALQDDID
jgi:hypothetical protein